MSANHVRKWEPIEDLPESWRTSLENSSVLALVKTWQERTGELRTKDLYKRFIENVNQNGRLRGDSKPS